MNAVAMLETAGHFKWHRKFAWLPVAAEGRLVWLKHVERRCTNVLRQECARRGHNYIYRLPQAG